MWFFFTFSGDFVYITDRAYTESQIREMEIKILAALGKIFMLPNTMTSPLKFIYSEKATKFCEIFPFDQYTRR